MKILEIVPTLRPGGGERLVVDLCNELSLSQNVTLMTLWDERLDDYAFYKKDLSSSVNYINANVNEINKLSVLWSFIKHINSIQPNIVHLHMCHMFAILAILLLGRKYTFYLTIHNDINKSYSDNKTKILFNVLGRLGLLNFITISQTNHVQFNATYPKLKNVLIYNGRANLSKTNKFNSVSNEISSLKTSPKSLVFLHIARCNPQKNQKLLVDAFNHFVSEGYDAILVIIGAHFNDSEEGIQLKQKACKQIYFMGTRSNVADYILNADAFCLTSLYEGMPITLIECINSGIPIISTPVCGIIDVIKDGSNGILSYDFSTGSYIEALKRYVNCKENLNSYCHQNKKLSPFTIKKCASGYLNIFTKAYKN